MDKPSFGERVRYAFDNWMARGTLALMALLGLATIVLVLVVGLIAWVLLKVFPDQVNTAGETPWDILWGGLMRTLDPGTMGGDEGWMFRFLMLVITIGGLIIVASLIGIISGAFDAKVEDLRKGRSRVLEHDHTLILGWSEKVFPIIHELCLANESRGKSAIVILADRDKVQMEDDIKSEVGAHMKATGGKTRVIVRSGDPMNLTELEVANPNAARSIIVLAPEDDDDPDSVVIKTTLAVTNNPRRKQGEYHIVGELQEESNIEAATLVGKDEAHWVLGNDLISRIMVQTCRQSGLSVVYAELLDFDGAEIYFSRQPSLDGKTFYEAQLAFEDSMVMGLVSDDVPVLNPPADQVLKEGDSLILIAEDDDTIRLGAAPGTADPAKVSAKPAPELGPETTLILGYNDNLQVMLSELDEYSTPRSRVTIVSRRELPPLPDFSDIDVAWEQGDPTSRSVLDALHPETFDHILVLAASDLPPQRADAKTLIALLHLRDIADEYGVDLNVVSEMLDDRNRELAEVTQADDFIVSDKLISLMLSQVSENKQLTDVFDELFRSDGPEIYLRPADEYVVLGEPVDFYTVIEAARRKGETAIGHRFDALARDAGSMYGVSVNPLKTEAHAYTAADKIIVLAEN
ncbi:MAG: NAD-binding protein [Microbacteriaceae bacterium]|nr:NAD-binding protein [Microbacteriaceae bacterium]